MKFSDNVKVRFVKKQGVFVEQFETEEPEHVPQVITIEIVPKDPGDPTKGCVADPNGDIEIWAGDTVRYVNNQWNQDTLILGKFPLFDDWISILIPAGETQDFTVSSNFLSGDKYKLQLFCDQTPGGPRFVPRP